MPQNAIAFYGRKEYPAVSIAKKNRLAYLNALETYAVEGKLAAFAEMIAELAEQQLDRYLSMITQG